VKLRPKHRALRRQEPRSELGASWASISVLTTGVHLEFTGYITISAQKTNLPKNREELLKCFRVIYQLYWPKRLANGQSKCQKKDKVKTN
jgi:hypothetical protein